MVKQNNSRKTNFVLLVSGKVSKIVFGEEILSYGTKSSNFVLSLYILKSEPCLDKSLDIYRTTLVSSESIDSNNTQTFHTSLHVT